ncbi:D-arabinono-1,4-lactone oxidase [Sanguibacter sp. 25GB23B1]|uniref:D-arabinono-1,4-lactone oxidase n=1 Tax=unclassified Sanguibacter TaxID=2645534 RepID=UPI0032AEBBAE
MTQAVSGTNWARNLTYAATDVRRPTTLEEVQGTVTSGGPVRTLGSRHCFNDIADTTGTHLLLDRFEPLGAAPLTVDQDTAGATTVTVSGGTRYGDLATALAASGYAIHNLASLPHISVAGAIATATHGSGDSNRGLGGAVRRMDLVTGTGELVHVGTGTGTGTADGSIPLEAAVVHLGALGVVARVTLAVEPAFEVRQDVFEGLSWDALAEDLDAITGAAYSVSLFTRWADSGIDQVWLKSRTDAPAPAPAGGVPAYATDIFHGARRSLVPLHPLPGISAVSCTEQLGVAGPSHERLPHFKMNFTPSNGEELQTEYLVPRQHALAAIDAVRSLREHVVPLLQITEIRTMAADGLWLSPSGDHDCIGLHFTWLPRQREVEAVLPLLEEALAPFDARPHWGKLFTTGADRLAELYPRLGDFQELASRLDPHGVFRNAYLDRLLPRD